MSDNSDHGSGGTHSFMVGRLARK